LNRAFDRVFWGHRRQHAAGIFSAIAASVTGVTFPTQQRVRVPSGLGPSGRQQRMAVCCAKARRRIFSAARDPAASSGPATLGSNRAQVQLQRLVCTQPPASPLCGTAPAPCSRPRPAAICSFAAPGQPQIAQRLGVNRKDAARSAVLGRHVADGRAIGKRQRGNARPVELHNLPTTSQLAAAPGSRSAPGSVAVAPSRSFSSQLVTHHLRHQHGERAVPASRPRPQMPPTPQPSHAQSINHR